MTGAASKTRRRTLAVLVGIMVPITALVVLFTAPQVTGYLVADVTKALFEFRVQLTFLVPEKQVLKRIVKR